MTVHLHEEDLPADVEFADGPIAVDTETMGLNFGPRPALPGADCPTARATSISSASGAAATIRRRTSRRCSPIPTGSSSIISRASISPHPRLSRDHGGAALLHEDRLAPGPHLYRPPRAQGPGQGAARPRNLQAAADQRLGRARAQRRPERLCRHRRALPPRAEGEARRAARARGADRACPGLLRFPARPARCSTSPAGPSRTFSPSV